MAKLINKRSIVVYDVILKYHDNKQSGKRNWEYEYCDDVCYNDDAVIAELTKLHSAPGKKSSISIRLKSIDVLHTKEVTYAHNSFR